MVQKGLARATILGLAAGLVIALVLVAAFSRPVEPEGSSLEAFSTVNQYAKHMKATAEARHRLQTLADKNKMATQHWTHHTSKEKIKTNGNTPKEEKAEVHTEASLTFAQLQSKAKSALAHDDAAEAESAAQAMRIKSAADAKISAKTAQEATRDAKTSDKIMAQAEAMKAKAREAESIKAKEAKKTERAEREREREKRHAIEPNQVKENESLRKELAHYQQELRDSYPSDGATRTSHTHAGHTSLTAALSHFLKQAQAGSE